MHIGILGAGIVGTNTALQLQSTFPNAKLTIIADKFNADTLSNGAAGIFRPGSSFSGPSEEITRKWIVDSYDFYNDLLHSPLSDKAGVMQVSGYLFSSKYPSIVKNDFLERLLPVYRSTTEEELTLCPGNWKYGAFFTTMVIESGNFLPWALYRFKEAGGQVVRRRVDSFVDLGDLNLDCVVNCTGFGAQSLCKDKKLVPLRGQVYKVKAPWIKMFYYGDYDTYVVPGQNYVTLGGCRQYESYNEEVDRYDSAAIWDTCTSLVPSLKQSTVIKEWVGLRPYRSSVRCELENVNVGMKPLKVVHLYGHGGYGVTTAPGSSKYAVKLLHESLRSKGPASSTHYHSKL